MTKHPNHQEWELFLTSNFAQGLFVTIPLLPVVALFQKYAFCSSTTVEATLCLVSVSWGSQALILGFYWRLSNRRSSTWLLFFIPSIQSMLWISISEYQTVADLFTATFETGCIILLCCSRIVSLKRGTELRWKSPSIGNPSGVEVHLKRLYLMALVLGLGALNLEYHDRLQNLIHTLLL